MTISVFKVHIDSSRMLEISTNERAQGPTFSSLYGNALETKPPSQNEDHYMENVP